MTTNAFLVVLAGASMQLGQQAAPGPIAEPPIHMQVEGVGVERTLAEFMDVCFRPHWNVGEVREAAQKSDFGYKANPPVKDPNSFAWTSGKGFINLTLNPAFSQCALSIGSIQPRTGPQLLSLLKPAVEGELGHPVQENDAEFYLEWTDEDAGYTDRVTLAGASAEATQAVWYVFDRTKPGERERLEELARSVKAQQQ